LDELFYRKFVQENSPKMRYSKNLLLAVRQRLHGPEAVDDVPRLTEVDLVQGVPEVNVMITISNC
jgi:hypothetical protein